MRKKTFWFLLFSVCCFALLPIYKTLPIVRDKECYRSFFPKESFLVKLAQPAPSWMTKQISSDLAPFPNVTLEVLDQTYEKVDHLFDRYRIYKNRLYKYAPKAKKISSKNTPFEKALKTLLLFTKVPNVDFIYCPMDGLPEPYMPQDFYLSDLQAPIFAKARLAKAPAIILIPDQFSLSDCWYNTSKEIESINDEIAWEDKLPMAIWRGYLTDMGIPNKKSVAPDFQQSLRYKICRLSSDWVDAGLLCFNDIEKEALSKEEGVIKQAASKKEHLQFKYLPVLDGHMCTYPGYQWRLLSNSVCFKQTSDQEQWFYAALQPYVHYVPIENDLSDLIEKINWARSHDEEVQKIVCNAQKFAKDHLLLEDDYLYLYLALKEYASHQKIEWTMDDSWNDAWVCIQYGKQQRFLKSVQKICRRLQ